MKRINQIGCLIGGLMLAALMLGAGVNYPPTMIFRSVNYVWPGSQGAANSVLLNDGSGTLSWSAAPPSGGNWNASGTTNATLVGGSSQDNITVTNTLTSTGNISQTGAKTFSTGSGAVSLNGTTAIASGKELSVSAGTQTLNDAYIATYHADASTSGTRAGASMEIKAVPASSSSGIFIGVNGDASPTSGNSQNLTASQGVIGVRGQAYALGTGTITGTAHFASGQVNTNAGTAVTTAYGMFLNALSSAGQVYQIYAVGPSQQVNNYTAIRLATPTTPATTSYGVYSDTGMSNYFGGDVKVDGKILRATTITAAGTTGAQTINKSTGTVNFAAAATSLVVTDSQCSANSLVFAVVRTADSTAYIKNVVPANGSFTINLGAAATAETSVGFQVINF